MLLPAAGDMAVMLPPDGRYVDTGEVPVDVLRATPANVFHVQITDCAY